MSLLLPCPHCGKRPLEEFYYGEVPEVPDSIQDAEARDLDRAFMIHNTDAYKVERWFHAYGCRRWLTIQRNRSSQEILDINQDTK